MARLDAVRQALDLLYRYVDKYQDGGRPQVPDDSTMDGRALLAARAEVERVEAKLEACHSVLALIHRQAKTGLRFAPDNAALNYIAEAGASLPAVVANAQRLARAARGQS